MIKLVARKHLHHRMVTFLKFHLLYKYTARDPKRIIILQSPTIPAPTTITRNKTEPSHLRTKPIGIL